MSGVGLASDEFFNVTRSVVSDQCLMIDHGNLREKYLDSNNVIANS